MSRAIAPSCPAVGPWLRHAIQLAPPPPPASLVPPGRAHTTRTAHPPPCSRREVAPVQPSLALLPTPCGILAVACLQLVILSPAHALNKRCRSEERRVGKEHRSRCLVRHSMINKLHD